VGEAEPIDGGGGLGSTAPVARNGHACGQPPAWATLPPPGAPAERATGDEALSPGQVLAAPNGGRLRHLPPPKIVADAVPLDLDALEDAAKRARSRPAVLDADDPTSGRALAAPDRPTANPSSPPPSMESLRLRPPARAAIQRDEAAVVPASPASPVVVPVWPPTSTNGTTGTNGTNGTNGTSGTNGTDGTHGADGHDREESRRAAVAQAMRAWSIDQPVEADDPTAPAPVVPTVDGSARRRRPGMLVGSVVAFAAIALGTATWAQRHRGDDTAPAATASAATTAAPVTTGAPSTTPSTAPTASTLPVPTTVSKPASTVPVTTETTTATTAPAPTTAVTVAPDPPSPASVLGTTVLNRDLLDALGKGTLPGGQTWPRATYADGKLVVTGAAATAADADAIIRSARTLAATPDAVVNQLVIDASVPQVRYLAVQLFTNPIFDRGSTTIRKDSEGVFELWAKRLRDDPGRSLVVIAHGDGSSTALATTRAKNSLTRLLAAGGVAPEQVEAQWAAGPTTGPRVTFAITIG
jgi:outer membrane protein OmpA-like peptidoglycan-associated protein